MTRYSNYLVTLVLVLFALVGGIAALNYLVDPLGVYQVIDKEGFNHYKPKRHKFARVTKPIMVEQLQPKVVLFGSSRTELGLDPTYPGFPGLTYNFALSGAPIEEVSTFFAHTLEVSQPDYVLLGVDFFMFNAFNTGRFAHENILARTATGDGHPHYRLQQHLLSLLSVGMLHASHSTLRDQEPESHRMTDLGQRLGNEKQRERILSNGGFHLMFNATVYDYTRNAWSKCKQNAYSYRRPGTDFHTMARLQHMLEVAAEKNVKVILFISPSHAYMWSAMVPLELWPRWEQWKRDLLTLTQRVNQQFGQKYISLWDFTDYNRYITEPVPPKGDSETVMQWYVDPSHYTDFIGNKLVDRMFYRPGAETDLGFELTTANIDTVLATIRSRRDAWQAAHPEDMANINDAVQRGSEMLAQAGEDCPLPDDADTLP